MTTIAEKEQEPALQDPRPFLKWAGGKNGLLPQYQPYFPGEFRLYYEPFLGGGAVFFHLLPKRAILTDINPEITNVYRVLRKSPDALIEELEKHQANHCEEYFEILRDLEFRGDDWPVTRAARFIYLNKTCYNGLYRVNKQGKFNVPFGRYDNPKICDIPTLKAASKALQDILIECLDFRKMLESYEFSSDCFVYFDPPYHPVSETAKFTSYSASGFDKCDQIALAAVFKSLAERKVKVMLSDSDCPFIRELYKGFEIVPINAARSINSDGQKRGKVGEILVVANCN